MDRTDFHYELPRELIAQAPLPERSQSRLLMLDGRSGSLADRQFSDLIDWLQAGDLLVVNDTRVLPARLLGHKRSGGRVELLLERVLGSNSGLFQVRASKSPKPGSELIVAGGVSATVSGRRGEFFELAFATELIPLLELHGAVPLPPYIERSPDASDAVRYQTIFAQSVGAVAAPTAGLHFDSELLAAIARRGVDLGVLTLHVGAGTFQPVRVDRMEDHRLHAERIEVGARLCEQIAATKRAGGRIVAVGTTTVRALETVANNELAPFAGETDLFIYPGFDFKLVDAIVTNFHLPESSLLALVAAFGGYANVMRAYRHAVAARYRFFSYGDAMLLTSRAAA